MGGMTSIAMDVKYPDFFAGSYLVACKWDETVTSPLGHQHIWAVTSQGDPGASPSLAKIMENLEKDGVKVASQTLDPTQPQDQVDAQAAALITPDCSHYLAACLHHAARLRMAFCSEKNRPYSLKHNS